MAKPHMFSKIFDFGYQRTALQAFGFYLAHIILFLLIAGIVLGFAMGAAGMGDEPDRLMEIARAASPVLGLTHALVMSVFMLKAKNLGASRNHALIGALAIVLGGVGGPMLSLIPIAWLSTRLAAPRLGPM